MKMTLVLPIAVAALLALPACGGGDDDSTSGTPSASTDAGATAETDTTTAGDTTPPPVDGAVTLATCDESYGGDVADFYSAYFACVNIEVSDEGTAITTDGLPPHPSAYYASTHPNYVEWDDRGGTHNKNPNELAEINYTMTVPTDPVAKGITIDASNVDNAMNTSDDEYSGGPVGIALNGVAIFAAMAAPGDELAAEAFTFDVYEGHPAGTTYHYHFETPGPLEVLVDRGISDASDPGAGSVEMYGMMCDGTVVLGCTELDGSAPDDSDFDAQNGHIHDLGDGTTTHFENRYHTHVCPDQWSAYPFFPEIAYYETTSCSSGQGPSGQGPPG
jgi:hypothetical protein